MIARESEQNWVNGDPLQDPRLSKLEQENEKLKERIVELENKLKIDSKTGAYTEDYFNGHFAQTLNKKLSYYKQASSGEQTRLTRHLVFMIDMNGLKEINETEGYAVGDEALKSVADALMEVLAEEDVLTRMNKAGDEFILIAKLPPESSSRQFQQAVVSRIHSFVAKQQKGQLSVSLGCAILEDYNSLDEAKAEAEVALKVEKATLYEQNTTARANLGRRIVNIV